MVRQITNNLITNNQTKNLQKQFKPPDRPNLNSNTSWYEWTTRRPSESALSKSKEKKKCLDLVKTYGKDFREYLLTSTLHGLRYIGEKKLTWFERFFWLLAFSSSLICAAFFILNVYAKWRSEPMIVSINPENIRINQIPFPAVTICNVNQAMKSVAERYEKSGDPLDIKLLESLCSPLTDADLFEKDIAKDADWNRTSSFLISVSQHPTEMLSLCKWNSENVNCQDLFIVQLTDEGVCWTFNAVHRDKMFRNPKTLKDINMPVPSAAVDWTPEDGYPEDAPPDGFPWKPKGIGTDHGLTLVLDANIEEYYCASTKSVGFKIFLHNPTEKPNIAKLGEIYGTGIEARVSIKPRILDALPSLKSIDINKRLCFFSAEKKLVFYRTYTLRNCEMECESKIMLDICKCVLYYMPQNKTTRICGKADAKCYSNINKISRGRTCDECLPGCTEISYSENISTAPLHKTLVEHYMQSVTLSQNRSPEYFENNMLVIHFYFEDNSFMRFTKGEIFGLTEFLSSTGGLLGLCMGFSIMSAVEILYFLTLRVFCVTRQRRPIREFLK